MADVKVKALVALHDGLTYRKEGDRFVIDADKFDAAVMMKLPDQSEDILADTPEARQARSENAATAAMDFGAALAEAGADPAATAEAVGKPAPKASASKAKAEDDAEAKAREEADRLRDEARKEAAAAADADAVAEAAVETAKAATKAAARAAERK